MPSFSMRTLHELWFYLLWLRFRRSGICAMAGEFFVGQVLSFADAKNCRFSHVVES